MLETYDWQKLITEEDRLSLQQDITQIIDQGDWYENSPKYQTKIDVFSIKRPHWSKLRMSFFWSCFAYIGKEVRIESLKSWGMITSSKWSEDRDNLWHDHAWYNAGGLPRGPVPPAGAKKLSGVFYLKLPEENIGDEECGTEFAPEGLQSKQRFFCPPLVGGWAIYPAEWMHRPGLLKSEDTRMIVAADLGFIDAT